SIRDRVSGLSHGLCNAGGDGARRLAGGRALRGGRGALPRWPGARDYADDEARVSPRLVIFDADDTLRRTIVPGQPCPHAEGEWELLPGVRARLHRIPPDVYIGVASNQDHVGYGH